ncbi:hypothetical protein [Bacillus toyonensis]|uniref:hypothetical protein n=1 Tax=Bacillus toyonensis TaxID=155322 RepID=UPI0018D12D68|nr:hypothetical protein [Bacillus toyonensis]MBH0357246.1 hypothetical protein [Bacillus toyonensis biovar Thuringiensis]
MQYSKEVLDKVRSGDTSLLQNLSPLATVALGLQLQQEAMDKVNGTTIDFNKVGQTVQGLNNSNHATKPTGITFFKTDEEVTQQ